MSRIVVLLRHGRTEPNSRGVMISSTDPGLDETGVRQAREVASSLARIADPLLYSSPSRRAVETAEIVRAELGLDSREIRTDARLRELGFGSFEGRSPALSGDPHERAVWAAWRQGTPPAYPPGAEAFEEAGSRVESFFREEIASRPDNLIVVAHGHILRILIATSVLGGDPAQHRRLCLDHARIAALRWEGAYPRLDCLNSPRLP
jgi:broad specificity phosphatase PhoE